MNIQDWFSSGCDYASGVALYSKLKHSNALTLRRLMKKESATNLMTLKYELKKAQTLNSKTKTTTKKPQPKKKPQPLKVVPAAYKEPARQPMYMHNTPKELRPLLSEAHTLFIKCCELKSILNETPGSVNTYDLQLEIDEKLKRNQWCWQQITFFKEHGTLPKSTPSEFETLTSAQLIKRQQYKWQAKCKAEKLIEKYEAELASPEPINKRVLIENKLRLKKEKLIGIEKDLLTLSELINGN